MPTSINGLTLIHYNIRSLLPKIDELQAELDQLQCAFDIICITESWLTEKTADLAIFHNYNHYNTMRMDRRGGGVSVYVSEKYQCRVLSNISLCLDYMESLILEIKFNDCIVLLAALYRPPGALAAQFIDKLSEILSGIRLSRYRRVVFCGDFNVNMLNVDDAIASDFLNMMFGHSLFPIISKPTRITDESATLIDNIFVSCSINHIAGALVSGISDHLPIFLLDDSVFCDIAVSSESVVIKYRLVNDCTMMDLCNRLSVFDFGGIFGSQDVDTMFELFADVVFQHFNESCPIKCKTISSRSLRKPWIDEILKASIKKCQRLYLLYRQRKVTCNQRFLIYKKDIKKTWDSINSVLGRKRKRNDEISSINEAGNIHTCSDRIAQCFNSYFSSIGHAISNSIHVQNNGYYKDYLRGNFTNSFLFSPVYFSEIDTAIQSLKNKRCSLNVIPNKVLKVISFIISPVLAVIINKSVMSGIFPRSLKVARVIPLFKKGDLKNYRPISILSVYY